jgi:integrase
VPNFLVTVRTKAGERYVWRPSPSLRRFGFRETHLAADLATATRQAAELTRQAIAERDALSRQQSGPTTLHTVIAAYLASEEFKALRPATQRGYRQCAEILKEPPLGAARIGAITPPVVGALKRSMAATPWKANAVLRVLRLIWAWGRREGWCSGDNPAAEFRGLRTPPRQIVWSREAEATFLAAARPEMRLAYLLAVYTAQREGDLLTLPWSAYDGARITLRQSKTGELVSIPAADLLRSTLDLQARRSITILTSARGLPWKADHFRHRFAADLARAGLAGLRFADLRRTAIVRLGEAGCTPVEIAAVSGHSLETTTQILETYLPRNAAMASAAIVKLERRRPS